MNDQPIAPAIYYETTAPVSGGNPIPVPSLDPLAPATTGGAFGGALDTGHDMALVELVQMGVVYAFILAGALSAIFIFIGGISFILSGGDDAKIKKAVNTIRYAIVGLIITILSFTFITIIGKIFGMNLIDYLSYSQIKASINTIVSGMKSSMGTPQQIIPPQ